MDVTPYFAPGIFTAHLGSLILHVTHKMRHRLDASEFVSIFLKFAAKAHLLTQWARHTYEMTKSARFSLGAALPHLFQPHRNAIFRYRSNRRS